MSEPKPERITEADASALEKDAVRDWTRSLAAGIGEPDPSKQLARFAAVMADWRRLRALIAGMLTPDTVITRQRENPWATPTCSITAPDPAVSDLLAEAEAIRAEKTHEGVGTQAQEPAR